MQEAMKGAAKAMARMNAQTDLQGLNKILNDFQKENDIMLTKQEQMDEGLDEMFAADNEEGKIDDLVGQVRGSEYQCASGIRPIIDLAD